MQTEEAKSVDAGVKPLSVLLKKYAPDTEAAAVLQAVKSYHVMADTNQRMMRIYCRFEQLIPKALLYRMEEEIRAAYELNEMRLMPQYPSELFNENYIPELLRETERAASVARGFFHHTNYSLDNNQLTVEIPFNADGVRLVEDGKTPAVMSAILHAEFGIQISVKVVQGDPTGYDAAAAFEEMKFKELDAQFVRAEKEYTQMQENRRRYEDGGSASATTADANAREELPRKPSVYFDVVPDPIVEGTVVTMGKACFDISEAQTLVGQAFEIHPTPIARIDRPQRGLCIIGEVFGFTSEPNRTGDKMNVTFSVYDGISSIEVKAYSMEPDDAKALADKVHDRDSVAVQGYSKREMHKSGADRDFTMFFTDIQSVKRLARKDNAPVKRVELHLHTTMSSMDALIPPDIAVKQAKKWGMPAVAITDHGHVQGFMKAMVEAEKSGQKVIWGMEAYFVNDMANALTGEYDGAFADEAIVFDIETTGLSTQTCRITEIGAVRIKAGEVLERFDTFVDPECHIPEEITQLTSITDEMVAGAPKVGEALSMFFSFIRGEDTNPEAWRKKLLIAHNANFDMGFIRHFSSVCGYTFTNPYLDTVALSRFLNPDLKNHKLDTLAEYYELGDFNHHRACDDAEMLAMIYFAMQKRMDETEIRSFEKLGEEMQTKADPLKLKSYHQIILVRNKTGQKNLYQLISDGYLKYYRRHPRIPKTSLVKHREGLLIGSACEAGELVQAILENKPDSAIEEIVNFYDYLEIQPISNNRFMLDEHLIENEEGLRDLNRRIVALGEQYHKPVVATCDAHFLNDEDELCRKILLSGMKFKDNDRDSHLYFRTTEEMLEEFSYLGEEKAYEVVVTNTNYIASLVDGEIRPFPKGTFTPHMDGAEEDLQRICYEHAENQYGKPLPELVRARLDKELTSIIKNGFAVLYMIAQKLVWYSESQGYLVGSRGSVGSSFVASCAGISEVNPLPPHYYCKKCKYSEFITDGSYGSGFDLPDKNCPVCGEKLKADGHDIPFETFLGFYGDKSPDIDLNFSGEVQGKVHKYTEELFGAENVFRAGTIGELADKTAYGFIAKYFDEKGDSLSRAEMNRIVNACVGVKRTTGQHPGGIVVVPKEYEIYDFCPVQHPADDFTSNITTTHFTFEYLHDTLLKLDELGHDMPTKYKWLERFSGTSVMDVPMNAPEVYELFNSTKPLGIRPEDIDCNVGTYGLPEFGTRFVIKMLEEAHPRNFADLLQISGLSHGTDVWTGNAQDLIKEGICDISHVIGCRDNIMNDLIRYGVNNAHSFKIMEMVRKGKGLTPEYEAEMREANVPEWYIGACKKIKYMFPKAHAAAYVMSAIRLGWYKIHMPVVFYSTMFTVAPNGFDAEIVLRGKRGVENYLKEIEKKGKEATAKELSSVSTFLLVIEAYARGIRFLPVDINKSESRTFRPEGEWAIRMPFSSLSGLGETAADNIESCRLKEPFFSVEDLQIRAKLTKSVIDILRRCGVLDNINETDQLTMSF